MLACVQVRNALPETEPLWYMGQSREHRHLLRHPVISSFLWFKWERMRPYFNRYPTSIPNFVSPQTGFDNFFAAVQRRYLDPVS